MLHSGNLAAKSLTGNGLAATEAHYLELGSSEIPAILWSSSLESVKQTLKNDMSIRFGTSGWRTVIADDFTFAGVSPVPEATPAHFETAVGSKFIGELINEDKIILGGKESAGLSIKGHYPEKDGIFACLLAAEAVAARGESLTQQLTKLSALVGRLEAGRHWCAAHRRSHEVFGGKLNQNPTAIGGRAIERSSPGRCEVPFGDGSWLLMRPSGTEPLVRISQIRISNGLGGAS